MVFLQFSQKLPKASLPELSIKSSKRREFEKICEIFSRQAKESYIPKIFKTSEDFSDPPEIMFLVDGSGSMFWKKEVFTSVGCNISQAKEYHSCRARVFGERKKSDSRNSSDTCLIDFSLPGYFNIRTERRNLKLNSYTYADSIYESIMEMASSANSEKRPFILVFIGDGEFTKGKESFSFIIEKLYREGFLKNLRGLLLWLPYGVDRNVELKLSREMSTMIKTLSEGNACEVIFHRETHNYSIDSLLGNIEKFPKRFTSYPNGHQGCGPFYWKSDITSKEMALSLKQNEECLIYLIEFILRISKANPGILTSGIYSKIYSALNLLRNHVLSTEKTVMELFSNPFSMLLNKASDAEKQLLRNLTISAKTQDDSGETLKLLEILSKQCFMTTKEINSSVINSAMKTALVYTLISVINTILENPSFCKKGNSKTTIPIPIPKFCCPEKTMSKFNAAKIFFENFLRSAGSNVNLYGSKLVLVVMYILTIETLDIPKIFTQMGEWLLVNTEESREFLKNILGVKVEKNQGSINVDIADVFYDFGSLEIVVKFLTAYQNELGVDEVISLLTEDFKLRYKLMRTHRALVDTSMTEFCYTIKVPDMNRRLKKRDIVLLNPFSKDPAPALPSVGNVLEVERYKVKVLYLDEPSTKEDYEMCSREIAGFNPDAFHPTPGHDVCKVKMDNVRVVGSLPDSPEESRTLITELTFLLGKWKFEEDKGGISLEGRTMTPEERRIRKERETHVVEILERKGLATIYVDKKIHYSPLSIQEYLKRVFPTLEKFPNSRVLSRRDIDFMMTEFREFPGRLSISNSNFDMKEFIIGKTTLEKDDSSLYKIVQQFLNKLRFIPKAVKSSNCKTCCICFEPKRRDKRENPECGHSVCKKCMDEQLAVLQDSLSYKTQILLNLLRCPYCKNPHYLDCRKEEIPLLWNFWEDSHYGNDLEDKGIYYICKDCKSPFCAGTMDCGGENQDEFPDKCESCREIKVLKCPECPFTFEKGSGCNLMRCCPWGYHGCPEDKGEYCDHDDNGVKGCGAVFNLSDAVNAIKYT